MRIIFNSPVILIFSFLCAGVYLLNNVAGLFESYFLLLPEWNLSSFGWYFRLISYTFGHANIDHLIGNMAFVLLLGPIIESRYGSKKLAIMMIVTAIITALLHVAFFSHALLGASGIVFMLILLTPLVNFKKKEIPLTFILIVIIYIGKEIIGAFGEDNISHFAHIMGGIVGAIFGFLFQTNSTAKDNSTKIPLT